MREYGRKKRKRRTMIFKNLRRKELLMTGRMNTGEERGIGRIWDNFYENMKTFYSVIILI